MPKLNLNDAFTREIAIGDINEESRTVEVSFSSEIEVSRWFGVEILDHSPESVRLSRINDGGAVLVDHNSRDQVGVIENARIDSDRKGRATLRFGRSERANEIFNDVVDKIRTKISVGYRVFKYEITEGEANKSDIYRFTDWEPTEISFVSIPADITVGVGRNANFIHEQGVSMSVKKNNQETDHQEGEQEQKRALDATTEATSTVPMVTNEQIRNEERQRIASINVAADNAPWDLSSIRNDAISNGWSLEQFRSAAFEHAAAQPQPKGAVISQEMLSEGSKREYSLVRALNAQLTNDWSHAGFEREVSQELQRSGGAILGGGIIVPMNIFSRADTTTNASLIGTSHLASQFIDTLRDTTLLGRLGARFLPGLIGNVSIPKKTGNAQFSWVAENAKPADSNVPTGSVSLSGKHIAGVVPLTFELIRQSSPAIEQIVRDDMLYGIALSIDAAGFSGTGASNQPTGILNTTGVQTKSFASLAAPTFKEIVAMEGMVRTSNALKGNLSYVFHPTILSALKTTPKDAGSGRFVFENNDCNGYQAHDSTQLPVNTTIFGNFADVLIGTWGMVELIPKRDEDTGGLRIGCHQMSDVTVRHAQSFVKAIA